MDTAQIEETAASWLARRDGPAWSTDDEAKLQDWLEESLAHRVAFVRLDSMWRQASRLKVLGGGFERGAVPPPGEWQLSPFFDRHAGRAATMAGASASSSTAPAPAASSVEGQPDTSHRLAPPSQAMSVPAAPFYRRRSRAVAAGLALLGTFVIAWMLWPDGIRRETRIGAVEAVDLSDGSRVTMNTDTQIRIKVTDAERRVELQKGEAFFEVARDPGRPFVVAAGNQLVVAVGTKFSVRRSDGEAGELRVVVTEGRVRIARSGSVAATLAGTEVGAGSIARSGTGGVRIDGTPERPVDEYVSWRAGYLLFRQTTLADAVAEFNRYNTTRLVIEDPSLADVRIGGNFRATNIEAFVRLLEEDFVESLRVERRGEEIALLTQHPRSAAAP